MLLFAPPSAHRNIRKRLNKLINVPFKFEFSGSQIIFLDHEEDYSGLENERAKQKIRAFRERGVRGTAPDSNSWLSPVKSAGGASGERGVSRLTISCDTKLYNKISNL